MEIKVLGCGASTGVPVLTCGCAVCHSSSKFNKRLRSSILISHNNNNILIDCSPDFREQALTNGINDVAAVIITHAHADHIGGINDLRPYTQKAKKILDLYANNQTLISIKKIFDYGFQDVNSGVNFSLVALKGCEVEDYASFEINGLKFTSIPMEHGPITTMGIRFGNNAYCTDFGKISDKSMEYLKDLDVLIIEALGYTYFDAHVDFDTSIKIIEQLKPKKAYITHMSHIIDYHELSKKLPENVELCYDNMVIKC